MAVVILPSSSHRSISLPLLCAALSKAEVAPGKVQTWLAGNDGEGSPRYHRSHQRYGSAVRERPATSALFVTYGHRDESEFSVKTTQLSTEKHVAKRYADTGVLLVDMYGAEPDSDRCIEAYARLNYLHGHYIKQGKISNDDLLYTLSLFLNQPVEWINKYEWRQLTDLEICAMGVFHKAMGDGMEISFEKLPSYSTGWKDGLHFYNELDTWAKEYEKNYMVPHQNNYDTAVQTRQLLISQYPPFMNRVLTKVVSAPLDERLREAIMFDKAPESYSSFFDGFMKLRRLYLRYFSLPRPDFMAKKMITKEPDAKGKRYYLIWDTSPVYVKPTLWNRWGPGAIASLLLGISRPGAMNERTPKASKSRILARQCLSAKDRKKWKHRRRS